MSSSSSICYICNKHGDRVVGGACRACRQTCETCRHDFRHDLYRSNGYYDCTGCTRAYQPVLQEQERTDAARRFQQRFGFDSEGVIAAYFDAHPTQSPTVNLLELFALYPTKVGVLCEDGHAYIRKANAAARKLQLAQMQQK